MGEIVRTIDMGSGRSVSLIDNTTPEQLLARAIEAPQAVSLMMGDTKESTYWRDCRLQEIHDYLTGTDGENFRQNFEKEK